MKNIRIGSDVDIRWRILCYGENYDLTGRDITVRLQDSMGRTVDIEHDVQGSIVHIIFRGRRQHHTGTYTLTLIENEGKDGMLTVDRVQAFCLVRQQNSVVTSSEDRRCCTNVQIHAVELTSELNVPSLGDGMVKTYNLADHSVTTSKIQPKAITVERLADDVRELITQAAASVTIAPDSADSLSTDHEGLHLDKTAVRGTALTGEEIDNIVKTI